MPDAVLAKVATLKDKLLDRADFVAELSQALEKDELERYQAPLLERATTHILESPYRAVWSGEFEEMEEAEGRLMFIIPLSLVLIFILLYMAFGSLIDAIVVFSNVFDLAVGGIWALWLTGTNFSISAAVGFVSLFGVAIMDGLLLISSFNAAAGAWRAGAGRHPPGGGQACSPRDHDGADGHPRPAAGSVIDAHRGPDTAAAGHRGGRRHDHDAGPDALPDAGAVQLLRPPRAPRRLRRHGPLRKIPNDR